MQLMPVTESMFLAAETRDQPMHVGGLQLFIPRDGQEPADLAEEFYGRLLATEQVAERFLQRPADPAALVGYAAWQQVEKIDFEYHVRRTVLPRPGEVKDLLRYVSLQHGALLDRSRPMWEVHLIEGLADGRLAVYTKVHHSVVDGVTALRMLQRMLSTDPNDRSGTVFWDPEIHQRRSAPAPERGVIDTVTSSVSAAARTAGDVLGIGPAAARVAATGLVNKDFVSPLGLAPRSVLNGPIGSARRFAAQDWPTDRLRAVAQRHGVTVNDIVVAMSAGALRAYLAGIDALPGRSLTAMVPVSLHNEGSQSGNAVTAVLVRLATDTADPAERLRVIGASTGQAKTVVRGLAPVQQLALGAATIWPLAFGLLPGLSRIAPQGFNVVISSVPGGQEPLYWNGARLDGCYPVSIPVSGLAMNITVVSVGGVTGFGVIGDRDRLPHLQRMLEHLDEELLALEKMDPLVAE